MRGGDAPGWCRIGWHLGGVLGSFLLLALAVPGPVWSQDPPAPAPESLRVGEGSLVRHQVVALGRDLVVAGEVQSDVAALEGSVEVTGRVAGDLIVLGGDVRLAPGAEVGGDIFVLGGTIQAHPGAVAGGRMVAYPTASRAWLTLLEGPSLGMPATSSLVLGAKLALLVAWLLWTLILFATSGREVMATAVSVVQEPFRNFFTGLTAVLALVLTALAAAALAPPLLALPLLVLVGLLALVVKLWGMVAVFYALGEGLLRPLRRGTMNPLHAATAGLLFLGGIKLVPWVGVWVWTVATLIGVGAALATKLGRREPWFAPVPDSPGLPVASPYP